MALQSKDLGSIPSLGIFSLTWKYLIYIHINLYVQQPYKESLSNVAGITIFVNITITHFQTSVTQPFLNYQWVSPTILATHAHSYNYRSAALKIANRSWFFGWPMCFFGQEWNKKNLTKHNDNVLRLCTSVNRGRILGIFEYHYYKMTIFGSFHCRILQYIKTNINIRKYSDKNSIFWIFFRKLTVGKK